MAMRNLPQDAEIVVVGASGGIGGALVRLFRQDPAIGRVVAMSRRPISDDPDWRAIDLEDEASIESAFAGLERRLRMVIVATGVLHDGPMQPEKTIRALDGAAMLRSYRINAVGPALVAKHALPCLAHPGRSVFAVLGARVGSIGDNRAGGWHSYRAAKAALAMIVANLAIETARRTPELLCVGLHPGTVATGLSQPFQRGVADGGLFTPEQSAAHLLSVLDGLVPAQNGQVLAWDGTRVPA